MSVHLLSQTLAEMAVRDGESEEYYTARIKCCQSLADRAADPMEKQAFKNAVLGYRAALKRLHDQREIDTRRPASPATGDRIGHSDID